MKNVYAARSARIVASKVLLASIVVGGLMSAIAQSLQLPAPLWLGALAAGAIAYVLAYAAARVRFKNLIDWASTGPTVPRIATGPLSSLAAPPAIADAHLPRELASSFEARALVDRLEQPSLAWPFAAIIFAGPLTLHFIVANLYFFIERGRLLPYQDFGAWILYSLAIVGHAHVIAVVLAVRRAARIKQMGAYELRLSADGSFASLWAATVIASAIPGAVLIGLPPVITAVTAGVLMPLLMLVRGRMISEREQLEEASRAGAASAIAQLRQVIEEDRCAEETRAQAVSCLAIIPRAAAEPLIDRSLRSKSSLVVDRALALCLELHHRPELEAALAAAANASPSAAISLADLLSRFRDERIESALLSLLERRDRSVKLATIQALGRAGTIRSIQRLQEIADKVIGRKLSREAQLAISNIQSRLDARAGRGQLALASTSDQGALSINRESGALSFD